ncbi:MAG: SDR family oxidoreductase [Clostridia bacterium]|jgi:NAD(P)-dependent dehydrogenase (short-subunit alcohol dehydrogenase family)|nr:SDR family oxidoreductase [Clostridia bacterium]
MKLLKKNILITGGAGGIGSELVKKLAVRNQVIVLDKNLKSIQKFVDDIEGKKLNVKFFACDISDLTKTNQLLEDINLKYGKIDVLINNAAIQRVGDFLETEFIDVLNTNIIGTMNLTKLVVKNMISGGMVFNVLSVHAFVTRRHKISYDVSKAALLMFTKELALELAPKGITVNAISMGACKTKMNDDWLNNASAVANVKRKIPLGKIESAREVAKQIVNLLENFCNQTTGSNFVIDQGRSLRG